MVETELDEFVERSLSLLDSSTSLNERDVEDKILRPLMDLLGWDLYMDVTSQYPVQVGTTKVRVDYALLNSNSPLTFIETKASQRELNSDSTDQLTSYMRSAGVQWGLLTNGHLLQIARVESNSVDQGGSILAEVALSELSANWEVMRILSKDAVVSGKSSQIADEFDTRKQGIQTLENNKTKIAKEVVDLIVSQTDEALRSEIETEMDRFMSKLVDEINLEPSDDSLPRTPAELLDYVGTILPGRTEDTRHKRAEITLSAYKFLQDQEVVKNDEIKQQIIRQYPDRVNDGKEFDRHWVNYLRESLSELPRVEKPARGAAQYWRYITPELDQMIQVDHIDDWILQLDGIPAGSRESIARQQAMLQQAYDYIKENKEGTQEDIERTLPPYTAHYQDFSGFWIYYLRKAFNQAQDIAKPTAGHKYWYYTGDSVKELPDELDISVDDWVVELDLPGDDFVLKERRLLVQYAYNFLKQSESAKRSDFDDHFRYTIPNQTGYYNNFNGFWSYILKDALKQAPDVQTNRNAEGSPIVYEYSSL